ncbi:LysR family transcriptional regulator [Bacillota bacterium Meth-B3]
MNFCDIQAFMAIVETRSFLKASELLFFSQSTISRRLKNLEAYLGYELISRGKGQRSIELTARGAQFVLIAEKWLSVWHETQQFINSNASMQLAIGCTEWFNSYLFLPFYRNIMRNEKDLSITVKSGPSYSTYELMNNAEVDVGFVCNPQAFKGIETTPILRDPLRLVCERSSEWVSDKPISPAVLDPAYEVEWNHLSDYRMWHNHWWNPDIQPRITCDFSVSLCFSFIRNPNFWLMAPASVAERFVSNDSDLVIQSLTDPAPDFICHLIVPRLIRSSRQFAVSIFNNYLVEFVDKLVEEKPYHKY